MKLGFEVGRVKNVFLVGLGRISKKHIEAINTHPSLRLWGVCDTDSSKLSMHFPAHVKKFSDFEEALQFRSEIDLVSVLTYSHLHPQHAITALQAGIPVLVEKPLALSSVEAEALVLQSRKLDVPAFVVKQNRLNEPIQKVRSAIKDGHFGQLTFASAKVYWSRDENYYTEGGWRLFRAKDGGVVWNQASHYVDLLQLILGPIAHVQAIGSNFLSPADSDDTVFAHFMSEAGTFGALEATTTVRPRNFEGSLVISGQKGLVKIGGHSLNRVDYWGLQDVQIEPARTDSDFDSSDVYGFSHLGVYDSIERHISGVEISEFEAASGVHVVEIIEAIDASILEGRMVQVGRSPERL